MPTKWTLPSDIKALLLKRWENQALLRAWLQNELPLPYVVPLKQPSVKEAAEHFSKVREWIGILRKHSTEHHKNTYTIQWQQRNLRQLGPQQIPRRVVFETYNALFSFINKRTAFSTLQTIAGQLLAQWPQAKPALAGSVFAAIENAQHWSKILAVLKHFENHPRPNCYLRELNIPGVDTKFIEGRKQLLNRLLSQILPTELIDTTQTQLSGNGFEKRFGLRYDLPKIRFRILDQRLTLHGLSDLSIPIDQFAQLDIDVETVFITENKVNGLAFPAHNKAIVIFGLGNGIHSLQHAGWMAKRTIIYWGDIDTHGFAILSRLRERFPTVRSMLMDEATLMSCREIWGQEPDPLSDKLDYLTDEEQTIYQGLVNGRWAKRLRLEQERIPFDYACTEISGGKMIIAKEPIDRFCEEPEIFNELLSLDNKHIIELGCGKADLTRNIATNGVGRRVTAFEIDEIQHSENLKVTDLPNVTFKHGAAQAITELDNSTDIIFMFKSLHHVPIDSLTKAFSEIHRVLNANSFLYISEPIFAGEFNEILRLFHDEEIVRTAAFNAEKEAVASGKFKLVKQVFFNAPMHFEDFAAFEKLILGVTHTDFVLSTGTFNGVKARFESHVGADGAHFRMPIRVDLLQVMK